MDKNSLDDIETVSVLVQFKNGDAHQVLTSKEMKHLMLRMLIDPDTNTLMLSEAIEPVQFIIKK